MALDHRIEFTVTIEGWDMLNPFETKQGLPPRADIEESFQVAKEIKADYTAFYFLTPYPGTAIYETAIEKGWLDPNIPFSEIWAHRQPELPLMAITFGKEELRDIRKKMQNAFFRKNYLRGTGNISFYSILSTIFFVKGAGVVLKGVIT